MTNDQPLTNDHPISWLAKLAEANRMSIRATPVKGCPACDNFLRHTAEERAQYHPLVDTDFSRAHGAPKP